MSKIKKSKLKTESGEIKSNYSNQGGKFKMTKMPKNGGWTTEKLIQEVKV